MTDKMKRKHTIHLLLKKMSQEVLQFIEEKESSFEDRWVPAVYIKASLGLYFVCVPKTNRQYGEKGWLFAILARMLEDNNLVEYKKVGSRAFYRTH
jgi:hypothetical protein